MQNDFYVVINVLLYDGLKCGPDQAARFGLRSVSKCAARFGLRSVSKWAARFDFMLGRRPGLSVAPIGLSVLGSDQFQSVAASKLISARFQPVPDPI